MIKNFFKLVLGGFAGSVCGALTGFITMFLVRGLILLTTMIVGGRASEIREPIAIFSIGSGAFLGAIFGAIFALRK